MHGSSSGGGSGKTRKGIQVDLIVPLIIVAPRVRRCEVDVSGARVRDEVKMIEFL